MCDKEENGVVVSVSNCAGEQIVESGIDNVPDMLKFGEYTNVPLRYPYEDKLFLMGFALLVKRLAIDQVGLLNERFFPGNNEDVDYYLHPRMIDQMDRRAIDRPMRILDVRCGCSASMGYIKGFYPNTETYGNSHLW